MKHSSMSSWTIQDLAELTVKALELEEEKSYCTNCMVIPVDEGSEYCPSCYGELFADEIADSLAERFEQQIACERGLY